MGQYREITKEVTLDAVGGPNAIQRVWDAPEGEPYEQLVIQVSSHGTVLPANNLAWDVLYGGYWTGQPFASASTHLGGVSQGSGNIAGAAKVLVDIHTDAGPFPTNRRREVPYAGGFKHEGLDGYPTVVELDNKKASPITVWITFYSRTIADHH